MNLLQFCLNRSTARYVLGTSAPDKEGPGHNVAGPLLCVSDQEGTETRVWPGPPFLSICWIWTCAMSAIGVAVTAWSSSACGLFAVPQPCSPTVQDVDVSLVPSECTRTSWHSFGPLMLETANEICVPMSFFVRPAASDTPVRGSVPWY